MAQEPKNTIEMLDSEKDEFSDEFYKQTIKQTRYLSIRYSRPTILVSKMERKAYLYVDGEVDTTFAVALGGNPVGTKIYQGDSRTPEGLYRISWRRDGTPGNESSFGLSFLLDYPRTRDIERFREAKKNGLVPEGVDSPGGSISIHSGPDSYDWTLGCISILNKGMNYLMDKGLESGTDVGIVGHTPEDAEIDGQYTY